MYIITSKTKSKMRRDPNSQSQLRAERTYYYKEQGIEKIKSVKGKTEEEMFEEIKSAGSFVKDSMQKRKEERRQEKERAWKSKQEQRIKEAPERYFKAKEERAKAEAKKRAINLSKK